jgi:uncharacterized membrane protein
MRMALVLAAGAVLAGSNETDLKSLPVPLACAGGEPFWTLSIGADGVARYKDDIEETRFTLVRVDRAAGRPTTWRATFAGGGASHALIFDEQPACSDSDSDEPPPFGIILERGEGLLRGCCRQDGE